MAAPGSEPQAERPDEELQRGGEPERDPRLRTVVARAPGEREQQADRRGQVRDAHLAHDLRPERDEAVDPPVAEPDDPERRGHADEAEKEHHDVRGPERQRGQRRRDVRHERWPDEVRATVGSKSAGGYGLCPSSIAFACG